MAVGMAELVARALHLQSSTIAAAEEATLIP